VRLTKELAGLCAAALILLAALSLAQGISWMENYSEAVDLSEESGKPLFIYFLQRDVLFL